MIKNQIVDDYIAHRNSPDRRWQYLTQRLSPVAPDTIAAYKAQNRQSHQLTNSFDLPIKHVLVEIREVKRFQKEIEWEAFYSKYPESGGFIAFSRVGFNLEQNQALVYFEHWCRRLCGSGIYLLLSKNEKGWKVIKQERAWVS